MPQQDRRDRFHQTAIRTAAEGICVRHACDEWSFARSTLWTGRMAEPTGCLREINRLGWYRTPNPDPELRACAISRMPSVRQSDDLVGEAWEIVRRDCSLSAPLVEKGMRTSEAVDLSRSSHRRWGRDAVAPVGDEPDHERSGVDQGRGGA